MVVNGRTIWVCLLMNGAQMSFMAYMIIQVCQLGKIATRQGTLFAGTTEIHVPYGKGGVTLLTT